MSTQAAHDNAGSTQTYVKLQHPQPKTHRARPSLVLLPPIERAISPAESWSDLVLRAASTVTDAASPSLPKTPASRASLRYASNPTPPRFVTPGFNAHAIATAPSSQPSPRAPTSPDHIFSPSHYSPTLPSVGFFPDSTSSITSDREASFSDTGASSPFCFDLHASSPRHGLVQTTAGALHVSAQTLTQSRNKLRKPRQLILNSGEPLAGRTRSCCSSPHSGLQSRSSSRSAPEEDPFALEIQDALKTANRVDKSARPAPGRRKTFGELRKQTVSPSPGLHRYYGQDALAPTAHARSTPAGSRHPSISLGSPLAMRSPLSSSHATRPILYRSPDSEVSVFESDTDSGGDETHASASASASGNHRSPSAVQKQTHRDSNSTTASSKLRRLFTRKRQARPTFSSNASGLCGSRPSTQSASSVIAAESTLVSASSPLSPLALARPAVQGPLTVGPLEQLLASWLAHADSFSSSNVTGAPRQTAEDALIPLLIHYHALFQSDLSFFYSLTRYFWQGQGHMQASFQAEQALDLLLRWVLLQPQDFYHSETLSDACLLFCSEAQQTSFHHAADALERALSVHLQRILSAELDEQQEMQQAQGRQRALSFESQLAVLHQQQQESLNTSRPLTGPFEPSTLAEYLMASSLHLLDSVLTVETVRYCVRKPGRVSYNGIAPRLKTLKDVLRRNVLLEHWAERALQEAPVEERLQVLQHLLQLCDELLFCADFNSLFCIARGLCKPSTSALFCEAPEEAFPFPHIGPATVTWDVASKTSLDALAALMSKDDDYAAYHARLVKLPNQVVASSLDIFLDELTRLAMTHTMQTTDPAARQMLAVKSDVDALNLDVAKICKSAPINLALADSLDHMHLLTHRRLAQRDHSYGNVLGEHAFVLRLYRHHREAGEGQVPEFGLLDKFSETFERELMSAA